MRAIEQRGRTFDAVVHPNHYAPFAGIVDKAAFDTAWQQHPDWVFAHMSHAAYCGETYLNELFAPFGAKITFYSNQASEHGVIRGSQAYLAVWDDKAILAFRGTEADEALMLNLEHGTLEHGFIGRLLSDHVPDPIKLPFVPTDIVDDLDFLPFRYKEGGGESQLHRGFYKATTRIWPAIAADLEELVLPEASQLYVTGHSLGAAMAVVAGLMHPFKRIVTFGEPSVGNHLDNTLTPGCEHMRYVNGNDPVTKIVPKALYRHHGMEQKIEDIDGADMRYDHSIINYACILAPGD